VELIHDDSSYLLEGEKGKPSCPDTFLSFWGGLEPIPLLLRLLYQPRMSVEQSVECLTKETEVLGENLPPVLFAHHKSHFI
jgi:hypothetical protein